MTPVELNAFARERIACPLCRRVLDREQCETCGVDYPWRGEIWDLRVPPPPVGPDPLAEWQRGQHGYVAMAPRTDSEAALRAEIASVTDIYAELAPLEGSVIDIGGHQGRLRHFVPDTTRYLSVDPYLDVFDGIDETLLRVFPSLREPCNFVAGHAERLPIASSSFEVAHMRSVLDHLHDPWMALLEVRRVLVPRGRLVLGVAVAEPPAVSMRTRLKGTAPGRIAVATKHRLMTGDHHMWHPSWDELQELVCAGAGFTITQVVWTRVDGVLCVYLDARSPKP